MKVIFIKQVSNVGRVGEMKEVSDGYARNYLIPQGFAKIADEKNLKDWQLNMLKQQQVKNKQSDRWLSYVRKLSKLNLTIHRKANDQNHLFAQVKSEDIIQELSRINLYLPEVKIVAQSFKTLGEHQVEIAFPGQKNIYFKLTILPE